MLGPGDSVPDATVWMAPREPAICSNLVAGRSALFLFFLFVAIFVIIFLMAMFTGRKIF